MNINTKGRVKLTKDNDDGTSLASIENGFVEVSQTERKVTLVVFGYDISDKSIPIGSDTNSINIPNVTIISKLNEKLLLHWGANYLISTVKERMFGVDMHDTANIHVSKQYILA